MLKTSVSQDDMSGVGEATKTGTRQAMFRAADHGLGVAFEETPDGATSNLKLSWTPSPEFQGNDVVFGNSAPYAGDVEFGAPPRLAPFDDIKLWARRVLGDEDRAGAVWRKIAQEGTDAQPYAEPGYESMVEFMRQTRIGDYIDPELP